MCVYVYIYMYVIYIFMDWSLIASHIPIGWLKVSFQDGDQYFDSMLPVILSKLEPVRCYAQIIIPAEGRI